MNNQYSPCWLELPKGDGVFDFRFVLHFTELKASAIYTTHKSLFPYPCLFELDNLSQTKLDEEDTGGN